ncbi:Bromodomain-containing protein [Lophiotrema nucula]|uniref:Bromodomain-containing protein n=1 Tax=Lophiotrema nucula TaxID=690887 RepID=A0A6A5ZID8_9PLEO|nr:Bromodomain-containing protein [Lophiotrema nucula]
MESAAKRKAAVAAASEIEGRPAKRQKLPQSDGDATAETAASTTDKGLKFLESLKNAKDKTGRSIASHFLKLPDKSLKDYYDVIKLPISIESMENTLNRGGYPNLAQLESDCKRLVNNAKAYNDKKSIIYEDAERLRKTASNWMTKNNPAYRDGTYQAVATPVPGEEPVPFGRPQPRPATTPKSSAATPDTTERPRRSAAAPQATTPAPSKLRRSAVPEKVKAKENDNPEFDGKSFQQAQEKIIRELIDYQDPDSGLQIFLPFVNLPSRSLKDYYQLIKRPMSLSAVQKKVNGVIGRDPPTGSTTLKSWDDFARDMELIWLNARDYNEDGSDIYNLSIELEELFKERLEVARAKVAEPPQPKLKLNMSAAPKQQLKLKLRQSPGSEAQTPDSRGSATPGIVIDRDALLRQQRHVQEGVNGTRGSRPSSSGKPQTPSATNPFTGPRGASVAIPPVGAVQPVINGVKTDVQSPALSSIRAASTASDGQRLSVPAQAPVMPPPVSRPASGSPHPSGPIGQQAGYPQYQPPVPHYVPPPVSHFEHFRKVPLKSLDEALIPKITLSTNPVLAIPKPFSIEIPADKRKTTYSVTVNLPHSHHYLNIVPYVPVALTNRLYRVFVNINGSKAYERNANAVTAGINGANGIGIPPGGGMKKGEPLYEAKLAAGVNRIEIEAIAERKSKPEGKDKDPKDQVDIEKCTIFVNLLRS